MIKILFPLVLMEMGLTLPLVFDTPIIRKVLIMGLDRAKQGRGPLMAKTVAGTLFVVFISSVYGVMETQKRMLESGSVNPTDEVLLATHLLESSLMGFSLFLGLIIDRLHYHIKDLHRLSNSLDDVNQQLQGYYDDVKNKVVDGSKVLEREVSATKTKDKPLGTELKEADPKPAKRL